jgi:apolipoprotein N-acyltransferase
VALGAAGLFVWAGFGAWTLSGPLPVPPNVTVVIAQGNIPQGEKWDRAIALETFNRYLDLTRQGVARAGRDHPVVVVWPETASPFLLDEDINARTAIAEAAGGATVLAGTVRFDAAQRPRNSLLPVLADGVAGSVYDKWHLVPFGEYQPDWLPLPIQIVPGGGFMRGAGPLTLRLPGLPPVGALICYEAIFPAEIVRSGDRPEWLVNITNDAWFGNSSGPRQHLAAARLRAVEEGLPLVRAANTGISAVFDAFGHGTARLGIGVRGVLVAPLPAARPAPPFARFGLLVPGLLAACCLLGGLAFSGRRLPR